METHGDNEELETDEEETLVLPSEDEDETVAGLSAVMDHFKLGATPRPSSAAAA